MLQILLITTPITLFMVSGYCLHAPYNVHYIVEYLFKKHGNGKTEQEMREDYLEKVSHEGIYLTASRVDNIDVKIKFVY